jgi:hypothetical protein
VPIEMRHRQPFVVDAAAGEIIAPWPPDRPAAGDEWRLWVTVQRIDLDALPAALCWCWPDRDPEPVAAARLDWLKHYARDRAVYRMPTDRNAAT